MVYNSQNMFGCVGIKKGEYRIMNKKYDKEEYESLVSKIIEHMKSTKEFGEFFSVEMSPFGYNETQGQVYMPLTKEQVLANGWNWEDNISGTFGKETIRPEDLADNIEDFDEANESILKQALECTNCNKNYNIVRPEFEFYKQEQLPIPRLCYDCRYMRRIGIRAPRKLWQGQCMCNEAQTIDHRAQNIKHRYQNKNPNHSSHPTNQRCSNEFQTSYALNRKEIVYCEKCYQQEII